MNDKWRGAILYACGLSLYQDIKFGNAEIYAKYILDGGWTDRAITIPIAIAVMLIIFFKKENQ